MAEVTWIREDVVLAIHRRQLAEHGGAGGMRDRGLLDSALARPKNLLAYSEATPDLAALAASYAFGSCLNHPFVDDNKRVAFVVCRTFLRLNGSDLEAKREEKYLTFLRLAGGRSRKKSWRPGSVNASGPFREGDPPLFQDALVEDRDRSDEEPRSERGEQDGRSAPAAGCAPHGQFLP